MRTFIIAATIVDFLIYEREKKRLKRIISRKVVSRMDNLLEAVVIWGTGRHAKVKNIDIKGKTGTSQNYRDAWFIGFTDEIVIGIWLGNDSGNLKVTGGSYPAILFSNIIKAIYKD